HMFFSFFVLVLIEIVPATLAKTLSLAGIQIDLIVTVAQGVNPYMGRTPHRLPKSIKMERSAGHANPLHSRMKASAEQRAQRDAIGVTDACGDFVNAGSC